MNILCTCFERGWFPFNNRVTITAAWWLHKKTCPDHRLKK